MEKLINKRVNKLIILKIISKKDKYNHKFCYCLCDCGNNKIIRLDSLIYGYTQSCGCLNKENGKMLLTKHNMSRTQLYKCWQNIKDRCSNSNNKRYKDYGGRGIIYDPKWNDFLIFKKDMYFKYIWAKKIYGEKCLSIERENVNGNYCFDNCVFIPLSKQALNRRNIL